MKIILMGINNDIRIEYEDEQRIKLTIVNGVTSEEIISEIVSTEELEKAITVVK